MGEMKKVKQNTIYNFLTIAVTKLVTLILVVLLARYLGTEGYGKMNFALSFAALFSVLGDFGISRLIRRYISKEPHNVNKYIDASFLLKIIFNFVGVFLIFITAFILQYNREQMGLIAIAAGITFFANLGPFRSAFDAFERMNLTFFTRSAKVLLRLVIIIVLIFQKGSLKSILLGYLISEIVLVVIEIVTYNTTLGKLNFSYDKKLSIRLVKESVPFGLAALFMTIYDKIDITMLSKLVPDSDVVIGLYSSSYALMSTIAFLPGVLSGALAPIAYRNGKNKQKLKFLFERLYSISSIFALPIMVGSTILAKDIIVLVYGIDFLNAAITLQILIWAIFFQFQMFSVGLILNAIHLERITMKATMISVLVNVVLNFILIPKLSYIGAAITTVVSVATYFVFCGYYVKKNIKTSFITPLFKPVLATGAMALLLVLTKTVIPFFLLVFLSVGVYFIVLKLLKGIKNEDIKLLLGK